MAERGSLLFSLSSFPERVNRERTGERRGRERQQRAESAE